MPIRCQIDRKTLELLARNKSVKLVGPRKISQTTTVPDTKTTARPVKIEMNSELLAHAHVSKAWPFEEARKVLSRLKRIPKPTGAIIFETGYGPSGLPHIGTFGEVARTTMVRHAFRVLTEDKVPTRLIAFSDDMDGLRKVPDNIPNKEMVAEHLGKPLTQVPDPFGDHPSFGHHNNARLRCLPRYVRLRLRVSVGHRMLHERPLRQGAPQGARCITTRSAT